MPGAGPHMHRAMSLWAYGPWAYGRQSVASKVWRDEGAGKSGVLDLEPSGPGAQRLRGLGLSWGLAVELWREGAGRQTDRPATVFAQPWLVHRYRQSHGHVPASVRTWPDWACEVVECQCPGFRGTTEGASSLDHVAVATASRRLVVGSSSEAAS